jgi:hypothetical protein
MNVCLLHAEYRDYRRPFFSDTVTKEEICLTLIGSIEEVDFIVAQ